MTKNIDCPVCEGKGFVSWINTTDSTNATSSKICPYCGGTGVKVVAMTNGDRIRAMSDEKLGDWLCSIMSGCDEKCPGSSLCKTGHKGTIAWLKQPVEVDHETC